jgi:hypothetical protein
MAAMSNYVPSNDYDCLDLVQQSSLYSEVLQRRVDAGCTNCVHSESDCSDCRNNPNINQMPRMMDEFRDIKEFKNHKFRSTLLKLFHTKCPICQNEKFVGLKAIYMKKGLRSTDVDMNFCPLCGRVLKTDYHIEVSHDLPIRFGK